MWRCSSSKKGLQKRAKKYRKCTLHSYSYTVTNDRSSRFLFRAISLITWCSTRIIHAIQLSQNVFTARTKFTKYNFHKFKLNWLSQHFFWFQSTFFEFYFEVAFYYLFDSQCVIRSLARKFSTCQLHLYRCRICFILKNAISDSNIRCTQTQAQRILRSKKIECECARSLKMIAIDMVCL